MLQSLLPGDERGALREGGPPAGHLRARQPLRRAAGPRHPRAAPHQPAAARDRPQDRRAAARHQRQPLHPPRRPRGPRRAAVRADRRAHERPRPVQVPRRRALPEDGGRDAPAVPRGARGVRQHAVDRRAGRRRDRVRQAAAARRSRCPRASPTTPTTCEHLTFEGASERWGDPLPPTVVERLAYELQVIGDMGFSSYFLIVWDLIHHARDTGIRVGPGPGQRGRLRGGLLPAHHRPRPDPVRPAVRALPQPEPHLDARHRHGLRLPLPRRDDPLRRRALRPRPRRPDRHLLHHQGPGRGARRRPGARLPVRRRRQGGQGHAAAGHGPRHAAATPASSRPEVRRRLQDGRRPAGHVRRRPRRASRSSTWPRASRACAARTASTPPRW